MICSNESMQGVPAPDQAIKALGHILRRIAEDSSVGYYMGHGTESFMLATEALASLTSQKVLDVRIAFAPKAPRDPAQVAAQEAAKPLGDADTDFLRELEAHHEEIAAATNLAAANAKDQRSAELFNLAEKHERWVIKLWEIRQRKGES